MLLACALPGCGGAVAPPLATAEPTVPTASTAVAVETPPPSARIEADLGTLVFSNDDVWSALVVKLVPSEEHAVAIVEERDGARRLVRLAARGKRKPRVSFFSARRLIVQGEETAVIHDVESGRELTVPSADNYADTQSGSHWITSAPDGDVLFVDTETLTVATRYRAGADMRGASISVIDSATLVLHQGGGDSRDLVVADVHSGSERLRLPSVFGYVLGERTLGAVFQSDDVPWTVGVFEIATGRRIAEHKISERPAYWPELAASPDGRDLLVATLLEDDKRGGPDLRFELFDFATGARRATRHMYPKGFAEHMNPSLTSGGRVCLAPQYSSKDYAYRSRPAYDLRRGIEIKESPAVDRLCDFRDIIELPASLRGIGRQVVPSLTAFGMIGGGLANEEFGPNELLARVETDIPQAKGDHLVGAKPRLAILDMKKKRKLAEVALPELGDGETPFLAMDFSRDGQRLAACWNRAHFLIDVAPATLTALSRPCDGRESFSPGGRFLTTEEMPIDAASGEPIDGSWWTSSAVGTLAPR